MAISILIVDDHPIVRRGLAQFFGDEQDFHLVGDCPEGESALRRIMEVSPDVILVDLQMPGMNGLEVIAKAAEVSPRTKGILLAGNISAKDADAALAAGARGIVLKETAPALLIQCIREVHSGGTWIDPEARGRQSDVSAPGRAVRGKLGVLTARELQLVNLVADGLTNRSIADRLAISEGTVKSHLHSAFDKLGVSGRMQTANLVREQADS